MATMPELIDVLEEHRLDSGSTLELFGRRLREAGRITKGKRGRGAAHMTYLDAARMLIACAATDHPERAADCEFEFSNTINMDDDTTLDQALASVLEDIATGRIEDAERAEQRELIPDAEKFNIPVIPIVILTVWRGSVQARLQVSNNRRHFRHRAMAAIITASPGKDLSDRARDYEHATARFRGGKNLTAEFGYGLFSAVAKVIAGEPGE